MQTKVYLNDWFFNCGIVGFLKILEHNNNEFATIKNNYIEFDTKELKNFHEYYFQYFFDKYNIAKRLEERTQSAFEYIENNIEVVLEDKEAEKQRKEKIKTNKKYIKDSIKKQLDKIKKIDEDIYNRMKEQYDKFEKEETKEGIETIKNNLLADIKRENINKRLTLNLFKSILSNTYYGQPSFLNVVKSALSYEEQTKVMYKDYISNIIETDFIHDVLEDKYQINQISEHIKTSIEQELLTKEMSDIYSKLEKNYIQKNKELAEIKGFLKEKVTEKCSLCSTEFGLTTNYSEGNFVPLAISSDNARNFFWNQNINLPICDICKLILFCIPAGVTTISKTIKENGEYREKQLLSFVNLDTDVRTLLRTNNNFSNNSKYENRQENPYSKFILSLVDQEKEISNWQLENIFVVEFEAEYGAYSRIEYFNIKRYVAEFFVRFSQKYLSPIKDYKYKLQVVDYILKNKDIKYIINERLRDELKSGMPNGYNSFLATQVRLTLNELKKEDYRMEDVEKSNKKLYALYNLGIEIHEELKKRGEENKLNGYTYKMLNNIKSGNKKEFMDGVIRIHMLMGKDVPNIFLEIMQENEGLDFESVGHSFLAGLISNKYEKK